MADLFVGYNYPFYSSTFVLPPQSNERLIKNDLLQLLLTSPGERRFRPDFGTKIRKFTMQPLDEASMAELDHDVREAVRRFEPRVILKDVITSTTASLNLASVSVLFSIVTNPNLVLRVDARFSDPAQRADQQAGLING